MLQNLILPAVLILLAAGCAPPASTPKPASTASTASKPGQSVESPENENDKAVKAIERLGCWVVRDRTDSGGWIVELHVTGSAVADSELKEFGALKALQRVHTVDLVNHDRVTDAGATVLADWKELINLNIAGTAVTDTGLRELCGLDKLEELDLTGTQITDNGVNELGRLKKLQKLSLFGTQITNEGLKSLADLEQLQDLNLRFTKVTDDGVAALQKTLPNCKIKR